MIERKERYLSRYKARNMIKDMYSPKTPEDMFNAIFGSYDEGERFKIVDNHWVPDTKWWHRLNRFWAYPLTIICFPFKYVIYGETGWDEKTKFGAWIVRVTGYR